MAWHDQNAWTDLSYAPDEQAFLGNGLIGWRLGPNPFAEDGRCHVAGFCEVEPVNGVTQMTELPNPLCLQIGFGARAANISPAGQRLDYRQAALYSTLTVEDARGNRAEVRTRHAANRAVPSLLTARVTVAPKQAGPMPLTLTAPRPRGFSHLVSSLASAPGSMRNKADLRLAWRADVGDSACAATIVPLPAEDTPHPRYRARATGAATPADTLELLWPDLPADKPVTVEFMVALVSNLYHPRPALQAARMAQWGFRALGPAELFDKHCQAWEEIWRTRPQVAGDDATQRAIDGSMYHLHSSVHRSSRQSMAPFGLSGNGYYGHVFWDCETWTFPPVLLQNPPAAKSILEFRLAGLAQARRTAGLFGYDGAMFPWEAILGGAEDTPVWADTGYMEHHIVPDVAYAFWQYQCATGDEEFLRRGTWPILRDAARWVVSRVETTHRGCEIRHVVPADEHSSNVHNSAHTNLACAIALRAAGACAALVGLTPPKEWTDVADALVVPRGPDGMILQQDGWTPEHVSKQADTTLAIYPLGMIDDPDDIARVVEGHVRIDPDATCNVAMGDQINAVVCARVGRRDLARLVWDRGWQPYWIEPWGMYAETVRRRPGCFITGCGGLLQAVLMGFPGLQLDRPGFAFHRPALPDGWEAISCDRLYLRGRPHRLVAEAGMDRARIEPAQ